MPRLLEKLLLLALVLGIVIYGFSFLKPQIQKSFEKTSKAISQSGVEQKLARRVK